MFGETYFFRRNSNSDIVCAFQISNDSLSVMSIPGSRKRKVNRHIPRVKMMKSYPSVLIGRLGVDEKYAGNGLGTQLMDFIKSFCLITYSNKCRFITVDSYNIAKPLGYYGRNDFIFLFSTEQQEKEYYEIPEDKPLKTRLMYFDLMTWG